MRLTEWTSCGGCAAKWGGAPLRALISQVSTAGHQDLLMGLSPFDDAAVFRLTPDLALVSTTDFFPPLVDDPRDFGAVAAANACSDVFAMGGQVRLALNIAAFPEHFPPEAVAEIFAAASSVVAEAGGVVAGGHTIRSPEPVFGLAVQGVVHPAKVWSKGGARPGDRLVLSKPIGTGLVLAGGSEPDRAAAVAGMCHLNASAAGQLRQLEEGAVRAVTDVTGFGLAGHSWEMAERAAVRMQLRAAAIPLYEGAMDAVAAGVRTGGDARNRTYLGEHFSSTAAEHFEALVFDPQTSGGLLAAVSREAAARLVGEGWWEVGEVLPGPAGVSLES